jgi:hypothetical protein
MGIGNSIVIQAVGLGVKVDLGVNWVTVLVGDGIRLSLIPTTWSSSIHRQAETRIIPRKKANTFLNMTRLYDIPMP